MTADLAVVGGGIVGAFVAHEAGRRHPDWDIVVLERRTPGSGATAWSAGADFPIAATPGHRILVAESRERYDALRAVASTSAFIRTVPMFYVVARDQVAAFRARVVEELRQVTAAERDTIHRMLPGVSIRADEEVVTHDGGGAAVQARPLADALLSAAVRQGRTTVQIGQHVDRVERTADGYLLTAGDTRWPARRVVTAVGPWELPEPLPASLGTVPGMRRKRIAALHASLPVRLDDPLVYFVADDLFVLPLATGQALVSFRRTVWDIHPDTVDGQADEADLREGTAALAARCPEAAAAVVGGRAFCDLYTEDRLPLVRTRPDLPGLAVATAGSGSGVRLAPGLSAQAVRAVTAPAAR